MTALTRDGQIADSRIVTNDAGCWIWQRALTQAGYGVIRGGGYVHRTVYAEVNGPIPDGLELDHLCRNRACCNPDHLEAVTHKVNMERGFFGTKTECPAGHRYEDGLRYCRECKNARRRKSSAPRSKTHCPLGHPKSPENRTTSGGCRGCHRERNQALKVRKKVSA